MTYTDLPEQGWVTWPVGKGDSITVVVDKDHVVQLDLRDMKAAAEDDAVVAAVIDRLAETLPTRGEKPYLAVFAVGHHDDDHCAGAQRMFEDILVGELLVTGRMWHELAEGLELGEHATDLLAEATRRITATLDAVERGEEPAIGDRICIVGEHPDEADHAYAQLPATSRLRPGQTLTIGDPNAQHAEITVHGPVPDDAARPGIAGRNASSMLLRTRLSDGEGTESALLTVGDADYMVLERLFADARTNGTLTELEWDTHPVAHHCSLHAVFGPDDDGDEERKQTVLDGLADTARAGARMIASSRCFRARDAAGNDPPHLLARDAYEEDVVHDDLLCTAEYPTVEDPRPIVFALRPGVGLELVDPSEAVDLADEAADNKTISLAAGATGRRSSLLAALGATSSVPPERRGLPTSRGRDGGGGDDVRRAVTNAKGRPSSSTSAVGFG